MWRCNINSYGGLRQIRHISISLVENWSIWMGIFYIRLLWFTYWCISQLKINELHSFWSCIFFSFSFKIWIDLILLNIHLSTLIISLLSRLKKTECEKHSRWNTKDLNWSLVNSLEDCYAHKYSTNTHMRFNLSKHHGQEQWISSLSLPQKAKLFCYCVRLVGLGVWFSLRVREVPGSNPGWALLQIF